jgi:hypothetical protein
MRTTIAIALAVLLGISGVTLTGGVTVMAGHGDIEALGERAGHGDIEALGGRA